MTENKRDQDAFRRLAAEVVRASNDAITIQDFEGRISAWNRGAVRMYGYSEAEALAMNVARITAPDKLAEQQAFIRRLISGEDVSSFETRRVTRDGRVLDVWMTVTPLMDDDGRPTGFASTERDITVRRRAELEVQANGEEMRALVESSSDMVWAVDVGGQYTFVSPKVRDILGYAPEEVVGRTPFDFMEEAEGKRMHAAYTRIVAERKPFSALENINHHRDGHAVVLETSGVPVYGLNGEFRGYRGMDRDITERKRAEEAMREHVRELQRWHDVTLGREGRVIELKKEVNALLAQAGQPPRYMDLTEEAGER